MAARGWKHHAWRLLFLSGLAAGIGALAGRAWAGVFAALAVFAAFELFNLWRLHRWLATQAGDPPEGIGFWADIWDGIRQLSDKHRHESERYEARIREYRNLTHAMPDALLVIASDDTIASGNPAAEALLGLRLPADLGQAITHLVRVPGFADWLAVQDHVQGDFEMPSPVNDGQWLQVSAVPIQDGGRLIVFRDVTRVHNLEQVRRDFVANISHELRTPVTVILGYLELLQDQTEGELAGALERMQAQALQMRALLDDLLELSRLQSDEIQGEEQDVDVPALLGQLREQAEEISRGRHRIEFRTDPDLHLRGIAADLESAFRNLIMNAINYTPEGGAITVAWSDSPDGPMLSVRDTGIGIPKRHIPRLTERFYRVGSDRSRASGGTGLGLAIVKHVLNAHKARLLIRSELGAGSEFVCLFPREREVGRQPDLVASEQSPAG